MFDYYSFKLRLSQWGCLVLGVILIIWAILEKKGAITFADLYPGLAAIAAGLLLFGFLNYQGHEDKQDSAPIEAPIQDLAPGPSDSGDAFKVRLKAFTVGMALLCPAFLIWMAPTAKRQIESYSWPDTPGVVESTVTKTSLSDKKVTYFGRVVYRYTVNGLGYRSDLTDLGSGTKRPDPQTALADVNQYRPGDKVVVFYDPDDPSVAVIEKGIPFAHLILLIAVLGGSVVAIPASIIIIRSWLGSRGRNHFTVTK